MNYKEIFESKNRVRIEKIEGDKKEFVGYYDPEKSIHITSKREVAEFLIKEKKLRLVNVVVGANEKFYYILTKQCCLKNE